ncbi:MAG TPA: glycosyltransferase family 39 protein [Aggregatilineales bacterium]|nr:glycosyltransferase family 39 protein [Aggregatilineales bacterium]
MTVEIRRRALISLLAAAFLCAVYAITYTGRIEIADQLQYYSATASVARFGEPVVGLGAWEFMPRSFPASAPHALRPTIAEPGFIYAAAPLYWLADRIDGLGLTHTTWIFNLIMTPLVGVVTFWYALALGHRERTALLAMLMLGLLTTLWAYSQTFFREPFMLFWLLLAALALERWRTHPRRLYWPLIAALSFALAFLSKDAALMAVPGLLAILLPDRLWRSKSARRLSAGLLAAGLIVPALLVYIDVSGIPAFALTPAIRIEPDFIQTALHTYAFSIGGSFWGTSPILLLALPGSVLLLRDGQHRRVWVGLLITLGFTLTYAFFRGEEWFGGTIWPQRFLLPVLPFVLLLTLPVLERVAHLKRRWLLLFAVLALYSLWWQVSAVAFRWYAYGNATFDLSFGGLVYWSPGFNDVRFIRPVILTGLWGSEPLNWAWVRSDQPLIPAVFVVILAAVSWLLRASFVRAPIARLGWFAPLAVIVGIGLMLRLLYPSDPLYHADRDDFHALIAEVNTRVPDGAPLLINDPQYAEFYYNYGKTGARLIVLPYHPGDRGSCDQPLTITADNPAALIAPAVAPTVHHLAEHHPRLWLVMHSGPEIPCVVRPLENFLGKTYYRIQATTISPTARLIEYAATPAPDPYALRGPDQAAAVTYTHPSGDRIDLMGYALPAGSVFAPGSVLPLSLAWRSASVPQTNYTVAWFLADARGSVAAEGENTWPGATFAPTSTFDPGEMVWDNRALILPETLAAGSYALWVRLYHFDEISGAITVLDAEGDGVIRDDDGAIGVLPVEIEIFRRSSGG